MCVCVCVCVCIQFAKGMFHYVTKWPPTTPF